MNGGTIRGMQRAAAETERASVRAMRQAGEAALKAGSEAGALKRRRSPVLHLRESANRRTQQVRRIRTTSRRLRMLYLPLKSMLPLKVFRYRKKAHDPDT